jgi:hypothetical protein
MKDEGLDKIFKNGLSQRDIPFNMESWRRMEQMLPPENKATTFSFSLSAAVVGLLLVVSASLFFWNENLTDIFSEEVVAESYPVSGNLSSESFVLTTKNIRQEKSETIQNSNSEVSNNNNGDASSTFEKASAKLVNETSSTNSESTDKKSSRTNSFFASKKSSNSGFFDNISEDRKSDSKTSPEDELALSSKGSQTLALSEKDVKPISNNLSIGTILAFIGTENRPSVKRNVLGFIGGVNINNELVSSSANGLEVSEFLGVQYQRYLNSGWSIKANLLYSARNNVNSHKMFEEKVYDFGSKTAQTEVECNRMIYLELPVLMNYSLYRHNFLLGPSVSYLLNGYNDVTTHITEGSSTSMEEDSSWGYTEGFSSYDVSLVAGYEFEVKPAISIGARLNYGFIDITDDAYFNIQSFDNNVQVRVYLTISPFQF